MICKHCPNVAIKYSRYTSGEFCSKLCARKWVAAIRRDERNKQVSATLKSRYRQHPSKLKGRLWSVAARTAAREGQLRWMSERRKAESVLPFEQLSNQGKRRRILQEQKDLCLKCGCSDIWQNESLVFHIDHIDGNKQNNMRDNLRALCPNCHSQTPTYGFKKRI